MTACALVSRFVRTAWRCCTRPAVLSICADVIVQSARPVVAAATRRTSAALSFRTVLIDQYLKARIVAQGVPNGIYFQILHGDTARSAQQSIQNFDRATVVAENCVDFGYPARNFRAAKSVFAFRKQFGRVLRFSQRGIFFFEISEYFCEQNM